MIIQEQDYLMHDAFLQHYGVPGMKWGVRKSRGTIDAYKQLKRAKQADEEGWQSYKSAHDAARLYDKKHRISKYFSKAVKKQSSKNWADVNKKDKAWDKAIVSKIKAKKDYKKSKKADIKNAVKEYNKTYKEAGKAKDRSIDAEKRMKEAYKKTGRTAITRMINVARGKGAAVKEYNKAYREANKAKDASIDADERMKKAYKRTGSNRLSAIRNNWKYGK